MHHAREGRIEHIGREPDVVAAARGLYAADAVPHDVRERGVGVRDRIVRVSEPARLEQRLHLRPHAPVACARAHDEPEPLESNYEPDDPHEGDRVQEDTALAEEVEDDVQGMHGLLQVGS